MRGTGTLVKVRFNARLLVVGATVGALSLLAVVAAAPAAAATTYTVTTTADVPVSTGACGNTGITTAPNPLSLREATCLANNNGGNPVTITVPAGTYVLTNGELGLGLVPGSAISVVGAGAGSTVISGNNASRVLDLDKNLTGGVTTSISGVTITGGNDSTFGGAGIIGGSNNNTTADRLTLSGVAVTGNAANGAAPGVTNKPGGGIQFLGGTLSISDSSITNNSSRSSYGSGLAYGANGTVPASAESLTITNTTFSGNSTANSSGDPGTADGGALALFGTTSTSFTITNSRFLNNTATSTTGSGPAVGAAIWKKSGNLEADGSTFTGNSVSGGSATDTGGAVESTSGNAVLHYDRFVGNSAPSGGALHSGGSTDAIENWWGCNAGPGTAGCDTVSGTATVSPRLVLTASATPATVVGPNATSTITAKLITDSAGSVQNAAAYTAFAGLSATFADPPGDATVTTAAGSHAITFSDGVATIDYHSGSTTFGPDPDTITFDNATASVTVTVDEAPAITSASATTFTVGSAGSFTITTVGFPTPAITESGALPAGVTFTDNGDGTATLTGTPSAPGSFPLTITAANGIPPNATQTLTVTVTGGAPMITSAASTSFTVGSAGSFTVTTTGSPTPVITASGALPAGLTFTDNGDGTATLAGTPAPGSGGSYSVTVTASNGISPDATQQLTVQVNEAPSAPTNVTATASGGTALVNWTAPASTGGAPLTSYTVTGTDTATAATSTTVVSGNPPATSASVGGLVTGHSYTFAVTATNAENLTSPPSAPSAPVSSGTPPAISGQPPAGTVGTGYSYAFSTSGSPAPTVSVFGGNLPTGLTLSSAGVLSGVPAAAGSFGFTVQASNGVAPDATDAVTVVISAAVPGAPTGVSAVAGNASATVSWTPPSANGGAPILSYAVTGTDTSHTAAPVSVLASGSPVPTSVVVSGLTPGDGYTFTVVATNTAGNSVPSAPSATVVPFSPPTIGGTPGSATAGIAYSFTFTTTGYPAPTVTAAGALPPGLTVAADGTLSGTPTTAGSYSFTVTAANGHAPNASRALSITVAPGAAATVSVTSGMNQAATAGAPFADRLSATVTDAFGNAVPGVGVTFTIASGSASFPANAKTATVLTNAAGLATAPVLTAGKTAGPVTVTASFGSAVPATFTETVLSVGNSRADLTVSLSAPAGVAKSSTFTVTVTVKNKGPNSATSVLAAVNLGSGLTVVSAPGGSIHGGTVLFSATSLASNASATYVVTVKAGRNTLTTGVVAGALSVVPDPVLSNNLTATKLKIT